MDPDGSDEFVENITKAILAPDTCDMQKQAVDALVNGFAVPGDASLYQRMLLSDTCTPGKVNLNEILQAFERDEVDITQRVSDFTQKLPGKIPEEFYEKAQDILHFLTQFTGKTGDEIYSMLLEYVPKIFGADDFNPIEDISSELQDTVPSILKKYVTFEKPSDVTKKADIIYALVVPVPLLVLILTTLAATLWWPCCAKCQLLCSCSCGLAAVVCTVAMLLVSALNSAVIGPATTQLMTNFGPTSQKIAAKLAEAGVVERDALQIRIQTPNVDFVKFAP